MSTTEISYTHSKTLNLLLEQQVITQIDKSEALRQNETLSFKKSIEQNDEGTLNKCSAKIAIKEQIFNSCDDIKILLSNVQLEECASIQHHKTLCESYDLIENLLDHILQHVECVILEIKTSNKLVIFLNNIIELEPQEACFNFHNTPVEIAELEFLQEIKNKLNVTLNKYENIAEIRQEYERKKRDYLLALKNFKIILEVADLGDGCLEKLRNQFRDVIFEYRRCRDTIEQEMPFIIEERRKILADCLLNLGDNNKKLIGNRLQLMDLMTDIGKELKKRYLVANEQLFK